MIGDPFDIRQLRDWRNRLIEARMSNVREFQDQNGERVAYRSDSEMAAALAAVNREIQNYNRQSPLTVMFRTSKGL